MWHMYDYRSSSSFFFFFGWYFTVLRTNVIIFHTCIEHLHGVNDAICTVLNIGSLENTLVSKKIK